MKIRSKNEVQNEIDSLNAVLDEDEETGTLSDDKYNQCWRDLKKCYNELTYISILKVLANKSKATKLRKTIIISSVADGNFESHLKHRNCQLEL